METINLQPAMHDTQREVTLLFADLRGFTEIAAALQTDPLFCELLSHVMDCLTDAVVEYDGFVIDYFGDGLLAMWNAPADQTNHAELACRAGLQMLATLPAVAAEWVRMIHTDLRVGIGVHTGTVQVGNAGSKQRTKYGARGPNVHLASRVEAATKELRLPLVATQATVDQLSGDLAAHRVCRANMPGLQQPVDLYAVASSESEVRNAHRWLVYDRALLQFEQGDFEAAAETLAAVDATIVEVPSQFLLERVERELGQKLRRRSTDNAATSAAGVIAITAK
ncbi:MAG TPA: adenylate/guanylate cyclase domain-containing protein [Lacipirellulaceae bacterium]|jgi:adenylate cyclase|nr:adenylate/guanylate cyclase domain-containing protein [Lacipirellulaceae bacterium]